jgi:hypothetical protein
MLMVELNMAAKITDVALLQLRDLEMGSYPKNNSNITNQMVNRKDLH